ncbi:MAG TPA: HAD family hydrolase [Planctomycetaceae bacterium]|nr:HAD family hydrolase [Planctomycetaceae bacterium]
MKSSRAAFLDKDGTLIEDVPYSVDPGSVRLMPGALEGLRLMHSAGYRLVLISNQAGISQGRFTADELSLVADRLRAILAGLGLSLHGFYFCPHDPAGTIAPYSIDCDCRKPQPGMLLRAAADLDIDLRRSWMIGDILDDVEAGNRAGCRTVLVDNGGETQWLRSPWRKPTLIAADLEAAARGMIGAGEVASDAGRPADAALAGTAARGSSGDFEEVMPVRPSWEGGAL